MGQPLVSYISCYICLIKWLKEEKNNMPLAVTTVYCEPSSHRADCYFCLIKIERLSKTSKYKVQPVSVPSAMKPMPHAGDLTVFNPLNKWEDFTFPKEKLQEGPHTYSDPSYVS